MDAIRVAGSEKLSEILFRLFMEHSDITDVRFATDEPVRVRFGSNTWKKVLGEDARELVVRREAVYAFINLAYCGEESTSPPRPTGEVHAGASPDQAWRHEVKLRALKPSLSLAGLHNGEELWIRVRLSVQRVGIGAGLSVMVRGLPSPPESIHLTGLPEHVSSMIDARSGLVLICGPTGAGKSTSIAACLSEINSGREAHIVTIEDPVEFIHEPKRSFFTQREVGVDVPSFAEGVTDALRDVPDVIVIGEIRTAETMLAALRAMESGHLVLATMHASDTVSALVKMVALLNSPGDSVALSSNLVGVVAQYLVSDPNGKKHLAFELLDGKHEKVRAALAGAGAGGRGLHELQGQLRENMLGNRSSSMFACVKALVMDKGVAPERAAGVLHVQSDIQELRKLKPTAR